jgi:choline dehydrogenase
MLEAARSLGIPTFDDQNGEMMEGNGGAAITNVRIHNGRRLSLFCTYTGTISPCSAARSWYASHSPANERKRSNFFGDGQSHRIVARREIVLCLGAVNTPKVLMQSGIGDESELTRAGIVVVRPLPGVGRNFRDHIIAPCVWEYKTPFPFRNSGGEATFFWKSDPSLDTPDLQTILAEVPLSTPETAAHFFSTTRVVVNVGGPGAPTKPRSPARDRAKSV